MRAMTLLKIAAGLGALYLACVLVIALAQDRLLFPRWAARGGAPLPDAAERLSVEIADAGSLVGVALPAESRPPVGAALLLGFGGNAWDADVLAGYLHALFPARDVVTFHYRGYGPSAGRPSAEALLADAEAIFDRIAGGREPARIVVVGLSLGAGPAAHLASRRPVAGAILVTPFDSLEALARDIYPWLPVRLLLRHRMEVADALGRSSAPVAIIAAGRDEIVPAPRTEGLRRAAERVVLDRVIPGVGHNDIYDSGAFAAAMREALARIEAEGRPSR
jgi:pimeloyl-ACP methyl ester carboxylesterase